ncbi:MAG: AAA family ATPase, partial [Candidatus Nanohaloarchaea archaeon]|nr:AAA family ATPase [Candidatus Nanohaloarchaea archaeon]
MPHRTSFVHTKGGTGKTTAAVKKNQDVLLVDGDPEGHATRNLGLEPRQLETSLHDLLLHEEGVKQVEPRDCVYPTAYGVDVVPGTDTLHDTYNSVFTDGRTETLEEALRSVERRYDHVLIDAPSSYRYVTAA